MNIAINTLALYKTKGGMGRYIVELVNRIPEQDTIHTYYFYVSKKNEKYFTFSGSKSIIKTVSHFWSFPVFKILWEQIFLPVSLWKNNITLYHNPGFTLPFFKPRNTKYIVTIADMTFFSHPEYHQKCKVSYFQYMIPAALIRADAIITISENTKNDILKIMNKSANKKIAEEKIKPIYLGVNKEFFLGNNNTKKDFLRRYGLKNPYILFVGMIEPRKNISGLIEAYATLREKKEYDLVIAGKEGWKYKSVFDRVKGLSLEHTIHFLGYVPEHDLPLLYASAACFVYPSFYEGFGIPILEAMACGCAVIASDNSSMREIAGDAAVLIDPKNTEAMKEAITMLLQDKKEREERKKAGLLQSKKFCWDAMVRETKNVYAKTLKEDKMFYSQR